MGAREQDLDDDIERAWRALRAALADHLAGLPDEAMWLVELRDDAAGDGLSDRDTATDDHGEAWVGAGPYVQVVRWGSDRLRVETVSNAYLAPARALDDRAAAALRALGWHEPTHGRDGPPDGGSVNFFLDAGVEEVDRVAVLVVRTLREVHGCVHPAFLDPDPVDGWSGSRPADAADAADTTDATDTGDGAGRGGDEDDPSDTTERRWAGMPVFPESHDHLVEVVGVTLAGLLGRAPERDDDGDWPITVGRSVLLVRVAPDRPVVELLAEVVRGVPDPSRLPAEVDALTREHRFAAFHSRDDAVVLRYALCAWPFAPTQLETLVERLTGCLEDLRRSLQARVGGRAFLDPPPAPPTARERAAARGLREVLEMRHAGPVPVRCAAAAFDRDRTTILVTISQLRRGLHDLDGHDRDELVHLLRLALRLISDGRAEIAAAPRPPRPVSEQPSLLDGAAVGEDSLDLGPDRRP